MTLISTFFLISMSIIGITIIMILGYTILFFLPKNKDFSVLQRFAISYGLGTGFLALSMFFGILLGLHSRISYIPILVIILPLFFYFKVFKDFKRDLKTIILSIKNARFNKIEYFCLLLLVIELFLILSYWYIYPIHATDAVGVYDSAAKFFFYDGNFNYYHHKKLSSNISYPILVALNLCFFYSIFNQYYYFSTIIFVFYFGFLILFLYSSLRTFNLKRNYSILISTFIALNSDVFIHAWIAYADLTVTFFYTISTIFLFSYFHTKKDYYLIYSSIFMGFMAWSKNEGYALLIVNSVIFLLYSLYYISKRNADFKSTILKPIKFFMIGFIIYLPWLLFAIINDLPSEYLQNISSLYDFESSIEDINTILRFLIIPQSREQASFRLFWFIFFLILVVNYKFILKENILVLLILCVVHFLVYIFIYIITPLPLEWQLLFSLNRELLHLTPICGFVIGILLVNNKKLLLDLEKYEYYTKLIYILITIVILYIIVDIIFFEYISSYISTLYNVLLK